MIRFLKCCVLILFFSVNAFAKSATVHITIKNYKGSIFIHDSGWSYDLTKNKVNVLQLDAHQSASYTINIDQPTNLIFYLSNKFFNYSLFLSPGDELFLTADFARKDHQVTVTGKGSNNNQPEIFALTNFNWIPFKGDKDPDRVLDAIKKQYFLNKSILANYIKVNKPSAAFVKNATNNLKYFVPDNYYEFSHNNNFFRPKDQLTKWKKIQDSIFSTVKLSNNEALTAYNYTQLMCSVVLREMEAMWLESKKTEPALTKDRWSQLNLKHETKTNRVMQPGGFDQIVLDRYFSGKAAEYAYAQTIKLKLVRADYPAVVSMYNHFKKEYPHSAYVKGFSPAIAELVKKQQQTFNKETVFAKNNGTQLNTLKDVLALTKGKVALVDMWGTWCSPCRSEIEKNAAKLEANFKGKNVNFIYIANDDINREKEWKKAIAYFEIEGIHILANPKLTKDIMGNVKASSYPTYILIKKDGTYRQTTSQQPVNVQAMIKEIETANL